MRASRRKTHRTQGGPLRPEFEPRPHRSAPAWDSIRLSDHAPFLKLPVDPYTGGGEESWGCGCFCGVWVVGAIPRGRDHTGDVHGVALMSGGLRALHGCSEFCWGAHVWGRAR